jgi:putative acetyltransferase
MGIECRRVETGDHAATRKLVDDAFIASGSEGTAEFLDALRADGCILGEWLAADASGPVGHIVFSRVWLDRRNGGRLEAVMLTPLAVRPDRQRIGIGTRLMAHALKLLESQGETLFFVVGHPSYYPRAGFRSDMAARVESPWSGNPAFMVRGNDVPTGRLVLPDVIANAH